MTRTGPSRTPGPHHRRRGPACSAERLESRLLFAANLELQFQAANFSFQDPGFSKQAASNTNARKLQFPLDGYVPFALPAWQYDPAGAASATYAWPTSKMVSQRNPIGGTDFGFGSADVTINIHRFPNVPSKTVDQYMIDVIAQHAGYTTTRQPEDAIVPWTIQGGGLAGKVLNLRGKKAQFRLVTASDSSRQQEIISQTYVFSAGYSPDGASQFYWMDISSGAALTTTDPNVFTIPGLGSQFLGGTPEQFNTRTVEQIDQGLNFIGAIPDTLFLYDFSGDATIWPAQSLNYLDQYDQVGLPSRYGEPGGNACGPCSLTMALQEIGVSRSVASVYDNVMQIGLNVPPNTQQGFDWVKAETWTKAQGGLAASTVFKWGDSWANVDANLNAHRPVVIGTKLGEGTSPGDGHVMLLLGVGKSKDVKAGLGDLYGAQGGDYYIVADPAGNYFADATHGGYNVGHYGQVEALRAQYKGLNYGGWFAIYPKAEFRSRVAEMATLSIGPAAPMVSVGVHSPVAIVVTDPNGRKTGIRPDGTVLDEIPDAGYQVDFIAEQGGAAFLDPEKEKGVVISNPVVGTYQVELVGTGSGPWTMDINLLQPGAAPATVVYSGTASPGAVEHFSFSFPPGAAPTVTEAYVRGTPSATAWADPDASASNVTFKEYLAAKGLGDATYGFRVDNLAPGTTLPWTNVNQLVLHYSAPVSAAGMPAAGSMVLDGQWSDYAVTGVSQLDPRTVVLTLDRALGVQQAGAPDPTLGDRVTLTVPGAGAGGAPFSLALNVLQGDADRAATKRVTAIDLGFVKARLNRTSSEPPTAGAAYTPFADLNGDGRITATDLGAVKARINDSLPPARAPAAPAAASSITAEWFAASGVLQ